MDYAGWHDRFRPCGCGMRSLWCLIGGLAVNTNVEPVYTLDADFVVIASGLPGLVRQLREQGLTGEEHEHSAFSSPPIYAIGEFPARSIESIVLVFR